MPADPYRDSVFIAAKPERVFEYFTRPEAIVQWMGERAVLDPRPGGEFRLYISGVPVVGRYVEVVHHGLPETEAVKHATGWGPYLPRLAIAAAGDDPGPDPWEVSLPESVA